MPKMDSDCQAMRAVGYRQLWAHLDGRAGEAEAVQNAVVATRRLAKRQLSWMRAESNDLAIDCFEPGVAARVIDTIHHQVDEIFNSARP
jgi:tRNA dimethylallyltransferase